MFVTILFTTAPSNASYPAKLSVAGKLSGGASKVVDNFSHVSIDHMNKESLDTT